MKPKLGVCYYPEHWPRDQWADDAKRMVETGITVVRIGEFAWARLEPNPNEFDFEWFDDAISTLGEAGLEVVLGTPTATPPRWMLAKHPDMIARDATGAPRKFGSRRHYCFSHKGYLRECKRIARILGERYGQNKHVVGWQIDNEYGCHDTTLSYSQSALAGFREWLQVRYQTISRLNESWGNVFWSMDYGSFDDIDLPNQTVTEPNPAHVMAFRRFSSDQVVAFNRAQVEILRELTDAPLIHNYMGRILDFDHFAVGQDLDIASWDSYPIGFLSDRLEGSQAHKLKFLRQGDPDFQAFHHDLYRAVGKGNWWVMEQQPGPVNWAPNNAAPLPGMVRLWTLEAIAHGAQVVSYFRWRQLPFGQEQMHAGLLRHDGSPAPALGEVAQTAQELKDLGEVPNKVAPVAIVFDYASQWAWETQPQGQKFDYFALCFDTYRALRAQGLSVDFVDANATTIDQYQLIFVPGLYSLSKSLSAAIAKTGAHVVWGPRSASKTQEFSMPDDIPDIPQFDGTSVRYVESLPHGAEYDIRGGGRIHAWAETIETTQNVVIETADGKPVLIGSGNYYLGAWPDAELWARILDRVATKAGVQLRPMPDALRLRDAMGKVFVTNYSDAVSNWDGKEFPALSVTIIS